MNSRSSNNPNRFTPLIQWGDMERLRSEAAGGFDDAEREFEERTTACAQRSESDRRPEAAASGWEPVSEEDQRANAFPTTGWHALDDDSHSRRSSSRDRGSLWERAAADVDEVSERSRRESTSAYMGESTAGRATRRSERGHEQWSSASDEPRRESTSAYMGESTAGRATRRSERGHEQQWSSTSDEPRRSERTQRSTRGFTLVEDEPATQERRTERRSGSSRTHDARVVYNATDVIDSSNAQPTLRRQVPVESYERYPEDDAPDWTWRSSLIDALCFIPETIGSAILGALSHLRLGGVLVLVSVALTVAMLYNPTRQLYLANRQIDTLQQSYDALLAQHEQLEYKIEQLQTREGIEDEARARGYVLPGETKVVVQGLPEEKGEGVSAYTITDEELPDTRPWYIRLLDLVFGYQPEE